MRYSKSNLRFIISIFPVYGHGASSHLGILAQLPLIIRANFNQTWYKTFLVEVQVSAKERSNSFSFQLPLLQDLGTGNRADKNKQSIDQSI